MSFPCITHNLLVGAGCFIDGRHLDGEPHFLQRLDLESGRMVDTERQCPGCLPRRAEYGQVCWSCWEKLNDALDNAVDMITHLRSVTRAAQSDNAGIRTGSGWVLPVPATWRLADELVMLLGHPAPGFPSDAGVFEVEAITERYLDAIHPDSWVTLDDGAEAAVRFYLLMQTAIAQHPRQEDEHRIHLIRCEKCRMRTLLWKPPLAFFPTEDNPDGRVRIVCTNEKCKHEIGRDRFEVLALIAEVEDDEAGVIRHRRRARGRLMVVSEACERGKHGEECKVMHCRCDCHLDIEQAVAG